MARITLETIAKEMGDKVIEIWYQTGNRKAVEQGIPPVRRADYIKGYLRQRYKLYVQENGKNGRYRQKD